jgi:dienelactone hydrolase
MSGKVSDIYMTADDGAHRPPGGDEAGATLWPRAPWIVLAFALWIAATILTAMIARADPAGPQGPEYGPDRRQVWRVPGPGGVLMQTLLFRPPGSGPFPLAVLNHGSDQNAEWRAKATPDALTVPARWFVQQGYAVAIPLRPGHGATGGPYLDDQRGCENADYRSAGSATARSIMAAVDYFTAQPFVRPTGALVVGQSAGGWGALAVASRNPRNVAAVIAFAAGRGGRIDGRPNNNCAPERLIDAAGHFGSLARVPVLAIYTENDSYFSPALSRALTDAFRRAGGRIDYRLLPSFSRDGHWLFESRDGVVVWAPVVEHFLANLR